MWTKAQVYLKMLVRNEHTVTVFVKTPYSIISTNSRLIYIWQKDRPKPNLIQNNLKDLDWRNPKKIQNEILTK
jgi:hypothetical protein